MTGNSTQELKRLVEAGGEQGSRALDELKRRQKDNRSKYAARALADLASLAARTPLEQGCERCGEQACGEGHIYVILLDQSAVQDARMLAENPVENTGGHPVYVGSTNHTVECNYENGHLGEKGGTYDCSCFGPVPERRECITRRATHSWWEPKGLCYDLFAGRNPVPKGTEKDHEEQLAADLRARGFLVWQK